MGRELYELLFKGYATKQWGMDPRELNSEVTNRIPIRLNNDDRYFTDVYQAMPTGGYTKLFENMVRNKNITIVYNTDYEQIKTKLLVMKNSFLRVG